MSNINNDSKQVNFFAENSNTFTDILSREIANRQWPEPAPLPAETCPVLPLSPEIVPEPLRGYVMDSAERLNAPADFIAAPLLVALGSNIGRGCGILPKANDTGWIVFPNMWGGCIARTGSMKTPASNEGLKGLQEIEKQLAKEYEEAKRKYDFEESVRLIKKANITEQLKKKTITCGNDVFEQSLIIQLESLNVEPPIQKRKITSDATVEKQGELLRDNPRGYLLYRDELSGLLKSMDQRGHETDRSFYLEGWNGNGSGYTVDRIGRGSIRIENVIISIFGNATFEVLSTYVNQANSNGKSDDGFLQRFSLMVYPDNPTEFKNVDREPNYYEQQRVLQIFKKLSGDIPAPKNEGIPFLKFSAEAQLLFDNWLHELWLKTKQCTLPAFESHLTKYRKLLPSLALIFQLVNDVDKNVCPQYVTVESTKLALEWCMYLESHARRIYDSEVIYGVKEAKLLLKHITVGQIETLDSVRDIYRRHWTGLKTPEAVKSGLKVLEDYGYVIVHKVMVMRKPSEFIEVNTHLTM